MMEGILRVGLDKEIGKCFLLGLVVLMRFR